MTIRATGNPGARPDPRGGEPPTPRLRPGPPPRGVPGPCLRLGGRLLAQFPAPLKERALRALSTSALRPVAGCPRSSPRP
ncbi:hypothetical protein GCM10010394_63220 [Streptomyces crystallinus]|uniref:Uncharacterized protein n=1 Tax=Streptomyces crystallinus TaxID=68191 RepID=A0ABN2XVR3_9ACTN